MDARIEDLGDWRGEMLSRLRALIRKADLEVAKQWKWNVIHLPSPLSSTPFLQKAGPRKMPVRIPSQTYFAEINRSGQGAFGA